MSKILIANWKMNLTVGEGLKYIKALKKSKQEAVIAAPFTFLSALKTVADSRKIKLAGQNVSQFSEGAFTGEISAKMLKESGCAYCLVGHSERRIYFQETDTQINQKIKNLLNNPAILFINIICFLSLCPVTINKNFCVLDLLRSAADNNKRGNFRLYTCRLCIY